MSNRKPIDFQTFKKIQKMSVNQFNHWLMDMCKTVYDDGFDYAIDYTMKDCVAAVDTDRLMEIILSVKGVGKTRAHQIVDKLMEEGLSYYGNQT